MKKFEYDTVKVNTTGIWTGGGIDDDQFRQLLNQKGRQGWELVSCLVTAKGFGESKFIVAVLKREIE